MLDFADAPKREITVQGLIMQAPQPYEEGHELTKNEAGVMNQVYIENLRNNFAGKIKKACEDQKVENSVDLTEDTKQALQKDFFTYAEGYEFGTSGRTQVDPVRNQALQLAIGCVKEALKERGLKLAEVGAEKIKDMAERAVDTNPAFMEKAEQIISVKRAAAKDVKFEL